MKLAGFLLLQLAAVWLACQKIASEKEKLQTLQSFCLLLEQLSGALQSEASPMPELLQTLKRRTDGQAGAFLEALTTSMDALGRLSFQELWCHALEKSALDLDDASRQSLAELGSVLGRYELGVQLDAVSACLTELRKRVSLAETALPRDSRLTLALALSASAFLGIMLI